MARTFGGSGSADRVDLGSPSSLDDLDPITILAWVYPTAFVDALRIWSKGTNAEHTMRLTGPIGRMAYLRGRATQTLEYRSNNSPIPLLSPVNTWIFAGVTFRSAGVAGALVHFYRGDLATLAVDWGATMTQDGSGAYTSEAANDAHIGNRPGTANQAFPGRIGFVHVLAEELTLEQIRAQQFWPHPRASSRLFMHLGWGGAGSVDWSGQVNNGTVSGTSLADHMPIATMVPEARWEDVAIPLIRQPGHAAALARPVGAASALARQVGDAAAVL